VQLVKQGYRILDGANQSIFMANITKILSDKENVVFTAASVKSSLNVEPLVERACREEIQCMCRRWTRRGVVVFVRTSIGTRAGKTVTSVYGNTTKWAKQKEEAFV
jgi:quinolinate synthase